MLKTIEAEYDWKFDAACGFSSYVNTEKSRTQRRSTYTRFFLVFEESLAKLIYNIALKLR